MMFFTLGISCTPRCTACAMTFHVTLAETLSTPATPLAAAISAWRKDKSATPIDFDALPAVDVDVPGFYFNEQVSQEFQLLYEGDKLVVYALGEEDVDEKLLPAIRARMNK